MVSGNSKLTALSARRLTRCTLYNASASTAAVAIVSPAIVREAGFSLGEFNLLNRSDELSDGIIPNFGKAAAVKMNSTPFPQNEKQINKLQATGGKGYCLVKRMRDHSAPIKGVGVLSS